METNKSLIQDNTDRSLNYLLTESSTSFSLVDILNSHAKEQKDYNLTMTVDEEDHLVTVRVQKIVFEHTNCIMLIIQDISHISKLEKERQLRINIKGKFSYMQHESKNTL